jgi:hypothetical protein
MQRLKAALTRVLVAAFISAGASAVPLVRTVAGVVAAVPSRIQTLHCGTSPTAAADGLR